MTLTQLRRFLALAEVKNFHTSAERLHITQPALSQSIQKLEASIGEPLFLRSSRGVELTEIGQRLVPRAKLIIKLGLDFQHEVEELQNRRDANLKIGVAPYFSRDLFPAAYSLFAARRPDVLVDILEEQTLPLVHALEEGDIDLAFCGLNAEAESHASVEFEQLCTEGYSLYARQDHPLFESESEPLDSLTQYPWAVHNRGMSNAAMSSVFESRGLPMPRFSVETHSLQLLTSIVCESEHIALIANDYVRPELASGRIREIKQTAIDISTRGGVFRHKDTPVSSAQSDMIAALTKVCRNRDS